MSAANLYADSQATHVDAEDWRADVVSEQPMMVSGKRTARAGCAFSL
jgi:hypothetical protein